MAQNKTVTSFRFPYLHIKVSITKKDFEWEALIDTGYDGGVIIPPTLITNGEVSGWLVDCKLADNSIVEVQAYLGSVRLGDKKLNNITVLIMGDEPIIGRGIIKHFKIILDHGQKVVLKP